MKRKFRILLLGDSIPFYGKSIEDTYVGQLETKLNEYPELVPTEVINAGIKGYTNYQELVYLKKYGLSFKPNLVGVSFCLNDLHKYLHQFRIENGHLVGDNYFITKEAMQSVEGPVYRIVHGSHFLLWLWERLWVLDSSIKLKLQQGFTFDYRPDFNTAWKDECWTTIEKQLDEMVALGAKHDFRIFLVAFPFGQQLRDDYLTKDYDYVTMPQRRLKVICKSHDIPFLDLFPYLARNKHFKSDDVHLRKLGRKLAAEKIAVFLKEQSLIPIGSIDKS